MDQALLVDPSIDLGLRRNGNSDHDQQQHEFRHSENVAQRRF
jgi:hypothetical protein